MKRVIIFSAAVLLTTGAVAPHAADLSGSAAESPATHEYPHAPTGEMVEAAGNTTIPQP